MAGGEGHRAGSEIPKQFVKLLGIPMLWWSVMAFRQQSEHTHISVVMHPGFFADWDIMLQDLPDKVRDINVDLRCGGRNRGESVRNGLMSVPDDPECLVAVHDAARPMLTPQLVKEAFRLAEDTGSAVPVWPVAESLRLLESDGDSRALDRSRYVTVQTPQTFRADLLHRAYELDDRPEFTDDASRVEALGHQVSLFDGTPFNLKVTNPMDFKIAETLLSGILSL